MALLLNDRAFRRNQIGMPDSHAAAFATVAQAQRCLILSRAVGPTCLQLLEQGYDTKGFRVHGKSCDWGPMAGFVMRDPRLNKSGMAKAAYNAREHQEALTDAHAQAGWVAATTPLKIYEARRLWLVATNRINVVQRGADRWEGLAVHPSGIRFYYSLVRDARDPTLWGVYLDRTKNKETGFVQQRGDIVVRYDTKYGDMYEPLLAMTNPEGHRQFAEENHRNAITGDYDLFALWPYIRGVKGYNPFDADRRVLGTVRVQTNAAAIDARERNFTTGNQGTKIGNITNRIYEVSMFLNSVIGGAHSVDQWGTTWGPFPRRNVCWHSDEAARPGVDDVDLPLLAITPNRGEIGVQSIQDFADLVNWCVGFDFAVNLAEGWVLNALANKPNRLGPSFAHLVPDYWANQQVRVPGWYNA